MMVNNKYDELFKNLISLKKREATIIKSCKRSS